MSKKPQLTLVPVNDIPLAEDVPTDNLLSIFRVITQMEHLCEQENGVGLSACQVGIPWKLFVVKRQNTHFEYYINCEYTPLGEKMQTIEGCLSLKNAQGQSRRFEVERNSKINLKGKQLVVTSVPELVLVDINQVEEGVDAIIFQHEIDHFWKREKMIDIIGKEIDFSN